MCVCVCMYVSFCNRTVTNFPVCFPPGGSPTVPSMESTEEKEGPNDELQWEERYHKEIAVCTLFDL